MQTQVTMPFKTEKPFLQTFPSTNNFIQHAEPNPVVTSVAVGQLDYIQQQIQQHPPQRPSSQPPQMSVIQLDFNQQQHPVQGPNAGQLAFASQQVASDNDSVQLQFPIQQSDKIDNLEFPHQMDVNPEQLEFVQQLDATTEQLTFSVQVKSTPKDMNNMAPIIIKQEQLDFSQIVESQKPDLSFDQMIATKPVTQQIDFNQHVVVDGKIQALDFQTQIVENKAGDQFVFTQSLEGQSEQMEFVQHSKAKLEQLNFSKPMEIKTEPLDFVNNVEANSQVEFSSQEQVKTIPLDFQSQQHLVESKVGEMDFSEAMQHVTQGQGQIDFSQSIDTNSARQLEFGQHHHHHHHHHHHQHVAADMNVGQPPGFSQLLENKPEQHQQQMFVCEHCQQTFYSSDEYQQHMKTLHPSSVIGSSSNNSGTTTGITTINGSSIAGGGANGGEKRYTCEYCKKTLSRLYGLTQHIKTQHNRDKLYRCQHCDKTATCFSELREHTRSHKVNSFECKYCKKKFPRTYNLTLHIRTHTGEKPFNCSFCDKTFARSSNLVVHQRTHTGEQPFQCKSCKKSFSYSKQLKKHTINCKPPLTPTSAAIMSDGSAMLYNGSIGENGLGPGSSSINSCDINSSISNDINSVSNASSGSTGAGSAIEVPNNCNLTNNASLPIAYSSQNSMDIKPDLTTLTRANPQLAPMEPYNSSNNTVTSNNNHIPHQSQNTVQVKQEFNNLYPTDQLQQQFCTYDGQSYPYRKQENYINNLDVQPYFAQDTMVMRQDYISSNDHLLYASQQPYTNNTLSQEDMITYINL